jgi:outer membrane protein TolC
MASRKRLDRAAAWACALLAAILLTACGCQVPKSPLFAFLSVPDETSKLRTIDGIDLSKESITAPETLGQVTGNDSRPQVVRPSPGGSPLGNSETEQLPVPVAKQLDLTLADARVAALESNLDLQVEQVNPAIARQVVSQETGRFEATFDSTYVRNRLDPPPGFLAGGLPDRTFDSFTNSVTQPLMIGGELRALHDFTKTDVHGLNAPNAVDTDLGLEFRQPLLRGFGYRVNTADIQIARAQTGIADARSKLTAIRVLADVERAYWRLYAARNFQQIALQQLDLAMKQAQGVKRLLDAGVVTNVELLVADSGVLIRENAAIQSETNVRLAERDLKRIMQRPDAPVNGPTKILLVTAPNPLGLMFDRQNLTARALDNRMEMLELQLRLLADSIESDVQRNSILPRLDLTAEIDALGLESSYRKSMDVLFENDFGDRLVGVALEVPLAGNVSARARLREVQLRMMQTRIEQERVSVLITQEVYDAIDRVEQNWDRVVATQRAELSAQRAYDGQVRLQEAGRQTVTDVLVALQNYGDAKAEAVQAVVDYQIAKVDLALAAGTMLGYGQVDWNPCDGPQSSLYDAGVQGMPPAEPIPPMQPTGVRLPPTMAPMASTAPESFTPTTTLRFPPLR